MSWSSSEYVYKCPHCGKPFKAGFGPASYLPLVLLYAAKFCVTPPDGCWTDGREPDRLYRESRDHSLSFMKCPTCSHLLWKDEAKCFAEIGYSAVDRGWSEARYYDDPTEQDYLDALETGLAMDPVKTHYLRMRMVGRQRSLTARVVFSDVSEFSAPVSAVSASCLQYEASRSLLG